MPQIVTVAAVIEKGVEYVKLKPIVTESLICGYSHLKTHVIAIVTIDCCSLYRHYN